MHAHSWWRLPTNPSVILCLLKLTDDSGQLLCLSLTCPGKWFPRGLHWPSSWRPCQPSAHTLPEIPHCPWFSFLPVAPPGNNAQSWSTAAPPLPHPLHSRSTRDDCNHRSHSQTAQGAEIPAAGGWVSVGEAHPSLTHPASTSFGPRW